jgi:hypothetical protein
MLSRLNKNPLHEHNLAWLAGLLSFFFHSLSGDIEEVPE